MGYIDHAEIIIVGRIATEPEMIFYGTMKICEVIVARNRLTKKGAPKGKWRSIPDYFKVSGYNRIAEYMERELQIGDRVTVIGDPQLKLEYMNDSGGKRIKKTHLNIAVRKIFGPDTYDEEEEEKGEKNSKENPE